jgi:diguanylate cyclase (GGDEF)-like protein
MRSPEETMRALWQEHRAGASESVGVIERAVRQLTEGELDEQLRVQAQRAAHTLIGSVGTFGNDRHGHAVGDSVLRGLAEQLRRDFRGNDVVGRWGGEEFIIGMYGMTRENGMTRLADTLKRFAEEEFIGDQETFHVSFSAGVAEYPLDGRDLAVVSRAADDALYRAKEAGRGRVLAATSEQRTTGP